MRIRAVLILSAVFAVAGYGTAHASQITYTLSGTGSGQLGADAFTNAAIEFISTADTSTIVETNPTAGIYHVPDITAIVSIAGLGTATFTDSMIDVANHTLTPHVGDTPMPSVGFSDATANKSILFEINSGLATYDLSTALGPITGTSASLNPTRNFPTDDGNFLLSSFSNVTFVAAVPEPSSFALIGIACGALMTGRRWRHRAAAVASIAL